MYSILIVNAWVLAVTFIGKAPTPLILYAILSLTVICGIRLVLWWRARNTAVTAEKAVREFRRTNLVAALLCIVLPAWAILLFPYGDAFAQVHVAFFIAISMISAMFCLVHLRSAALLVAGILGTVFVCFFATRGVLTLTAISVNVMFVAIAATVIILIQHRDFVRMINAEAEARRKHLEQSRLLRMIDDMPIAVMTVDLETFAINYINETSKQKLEQIAHLLPTRIDNLLGSSIDIFHPHSPDHQRRFLSDPANLPHKTRIKLGPEVLDLQISAVYDDDGRYIAPMLSWGIVTKEVEAENHIRQLAHYDTLTGLANRNAFHERLTASLARADASSSLLFIDLDGFKIINDTMGHLVGDELLKQVAARLITRCAAPGMTIGRLGGDEFAIIAEGMDIEGAKELAATVIDDLVMPYRLNDNKRLQIGASIGIASAPLHGMDAATLLSRADIALYAVKTSGKRAFRVFTLDMEARIQERMRLETELRAALQNRTGLFVFYQPIVDIRDGRVSTREALARWHHPRLGWIAPSDFIKVAEDSGLIDQLGLFVLERACREAASWDDGARVAVNVSAGQLGRGLLASSVLAALIGSGLPPDRLEIEVTESALLHDELDCIADLRQIRNMGVRVALDDFGTGFSSLAHLRTFPFDKIKIDGSFVQDAVKREDCAAVVKVIADLGKRLGVTIVAEGVETEAHLARAADEGCVEIQGYYFGRPAPSPQDAALIAKTELPPADANSA